MKGERARAGARSCVWSYNLANFTIIKARNVENLFATAPFGKSLLVWCVSFCEQHSYVDKSHLNKKKNKGKTKRKFSIK